MIEKQKRTMDELETAKKTVRRVGRATLEYEKSQDIECGTAEKVVVVERELKIEKYFNGEKLHP